MAVVAVVDGLALDGFFGISESDVRIAAGGEFERSERFADIAIGKFCEVLKCVGISGDVLYTRSGQTLDSYSQHLGVC